MLYQAFIVEDEEHTRSLPPNPFSDLSEKVLEEYKSLVERRQQGQEGTFFFSQRSNCFFSTTKPVRAPLLCGGTEKPPLQLILFGFTLVHITINPK